ncbi:RHS repeat domain-containing protein [Natronoflexus pectinivorans]|uniref:RHS repeat-associated protein n=1 Tax=Natronoflexus pectinivorans TaxID=682526 RepID=A0A4R2GH87_9BACT|nr:RHS repeat-associated core domain-containing protein [Natronoflexus pectinivorans]TCO07749.1 RHS repeat-associated protein [Natronoflexus pectinivorans]
MLQEEFDPNGSIRKLHYIYGGNGLSAIMDFSGGQETLYYTYTDYQGNLLAVTNQAGQVVERYAYDPWGARRNPEDWSQPDTRPNLLFSRGYTMHEHLDDFGLINMNGRMYDPLMAQFLSPDPHIQAPGNWFNYNRYAYCYNNPLIYTDPDGEFIVAAVLLGAFINTAIQGATGNLNGGGDFFKAMAIGGLSGAAGGFAGHAVAGALGIATSTGGAVLNGALVGASGGFTGGFVGGAGNAWAIGGASFTSGLGAGFRGGVSGAIGGAVIGGVTGGIQHTRRFRYFTRIDDGTFPTNTDGSIHPSSDNLENFSDKYFPKYKFKDKVRDIYDHDKVMLVDKRASAFTTKQLIDGKYNIYYANSAFKSKYQLFLTMGHEYIHVAHFISLNSFNENFSEYAAIKWESNVTSYDRSFSNLRLEKAYEVLGTRNIGPQLERQLNPYMRYSIWGIPSIMPR